MNATGNLTWPATKSASGANDPLGGAAAKPVVKGASAAGYAEGVTKEASAVDGADSADGTEDRFLKLLVAQMRNQDPLNPMDNAQVTSQLAQISTVRGIESLNKSMNDFVAASVQGTTMSSVGMLGKQVLVEGDAFNYQPPAAGGATRLGFELSGVATAARIELVDASGKVVHTRTMANLDAGMQTFEWDGKDDNGKAVAAGPLAARIAAVDGTVAVEAATLVPARVVGISQAPGGTQLELDGPAPVAPADVRVIL
jgi:flagellar basal-body rod modification protein FlgD